MASDDTDAINPDQLSDEGLDAVAGVTEAVAAEPAPAETGQSSTKTSDTTAEMPKNQAKAVPPTAATLAQAIDRRLLAIQAQLEEKERLQLAYVYTKVPKPYYRRWKLEGNEVFSLTVGLKRRRRKLG